MAMSESLWQLATEGDVEGVRVRLLGFPDELNKKKEPHFTTPLMQACSNNHSDVVILLLEAEDVDITIRDRSDASCVHWAAEYSPLSLALIMSLGKKDDVRRELCRADRSGNTPLHWAAMCGQYYSCQLLLADIETTDVLTMRNHNDETPVMVAIRHHQTSNPKTTSILMNAVGGKITLNERLQVALEWGLHPTVVAALLLLLRNASDNEIDNFKEMEVSIGKENKLVPRKIVEQLEDLLREFTGDLK